jgi:hypothetical protein
MNKKFNVSTKFKKLKSHYTTNNKLFPTQIHIFDNASNNL